MYLVGRPHRHKVDAQLALERLAAERRRLLTSSEVFQEVLHRYVSTDRRDRIEPAFEVLQSLVDDVLPVEEQDVFLAKDLVHAHSSLSARDALHAAVMRRRKIAEIVTFDRGFDELSGIKRLP
jgi:hypothetical protein